MEYDKPEMVDFNANFKFGYCGPGSADATTCNMDGNSAGDGCQDNGNSASGFCLAEGAGD